MSGLLSADFLSLILRIAVGVALLAHGLSKAQAGWGKQAGQWVGSMGIPPFAATLVTILEIFGGIFLILGFLVRLVAGLFAVQFTAIIAMKSGKMKAGFMGNDGKPGYEIDFTYLLLSLVIFLLGAGALSADGLFGFI
jgi:uncharacterized membrane protein YphA (DoxX/SURF4 family)